MTIDNGAADHHHLSNRHCLSMVQIVLGKPIKSDASAAMVLTMLKKKWPCRNWIIYLFFSAFPEGWGTLHVIIILGRSDQVRKNMGETSSFFFSFFLFPSFFLVYKDLVLLWRILKVRLVHLLHPNCPLFGKVYIFWEGHKILQNLHHRFDRYYIRQI